MEILNALQNIGFDWQLAVAHLVNFLIVLGLLNYFIFDPIKETLRDRRRTIDEGIADAKQAEKDRFEAKEEREKLVAEGRKKKQAIIAEAREKANSVATRTKQEAKEKAEKIVADGKQAVEAEREKMEAGLKDETGQLAVRIAEKIMRRDVNTQDQDRLVEEVISKKYE